MTNTRRMWDNAILCQPTFLIAPPRLEHAEISRYYCLKREVTELLMESTWLGRPYVRQKYESDWKSVAEILFWDGLVKTVSQLEDLQWLCSIRRWLMKRKELRKSFVGATYSHDDDNKGKQQETFLWRLKGRNIARSFS